MWTPNGVRGFFQLEHCVYLRTGAALPALPDADPADCGGWTGNALLPALPAIIANFYDFLNYHIGILPE